MYNVEFMNDMEFENLPYETMGEKVGVCDRDNRRIFVRASGIKPLDAFNAIHEIEHMQDGEWGKNAHHRDPKRPGVYYKGFGDIVSQILPVAASFIPGVGPLLGAGMGATGNFGLNSSIQSQPKQPSVQQSTPMGMPQQAQPQAPQSSVIQPSVGSSQSSGGTPPLQGGLTDRVRAFFSGRNPTQEFGKSNQSFSGGL